MTAATLPRTEPWFWNRLFVEQALFAAMVWAGFSLFSFAVTGIVSFFQPIEVSGWHLASQPARWFGFVIGIYVGYTLLPLYLTHGGTRHGFMIQSLTFTLAYGAVLGLLFTLTFPAEAVLYALAGWPHTLHETALYAHPLDMPMVLLQSTLIMLFWTTGGLMIGAAWYRHPAWGALCITVGIAGTAIASLTLSSDAGPVQWLYWRLTGAERPGLVTGVLLVMLTNAAFFALTWLFIKNIAIRNKPA